jgi:hypothetical protein
MARRYTYATGLSWGGDEPTAELDVEVSYEVAWGSPESGRFGRPEDYDPGCGDVVEAIKVEKINDLPVEEYLKRGGGEYMPGETVRQIIDKLEMDHEAEMLAEAAEAEEAAAESYLDAQADERRQERPHG